MISQNLINLVEEFEGWSAIPYHGKLDAPNIFTIGYGFTHYPDGKPVTLSDPPITREQGADYLEQILRQFINIVNLLVPNCNQNQKDALSDFAYNEGIGNLKTSTLLREVLANPNNPDIIKQFDRWDFDAQKHEISGLERRRIAEGKLYFTPIL